MHTVLVFSLSQKGRKIKVDHRTTDKTLQKRLADLENANEQLRLEIEGLRQSEAKFKNLAEQSPNMIFINHKGRVVYANKNGIKRPIFTPIFNPFRIDIHHNKTI